METLKTNPGTNQPEFINLGTNFKTYLDELMKGTLEILNNEGDRQFAGALSQTVLHIGNNLNERMVDFYSRSDSAVRLQLDASTRHFGANVLTASMLGLMRESGERKSGFWNNVYKIVEAIKKIISDILKVSIFGFSLSDLIGSIGMDIDELFRILDNILQTIGGLFGGKSLKEEMISDEKQNMHMTQELAKLRKIRFN